MPTYQVILEGFFTFANPAKGQDLPAGFFTTRHVIADGKKEAITKSIDNVLDELSDKIGEISYNEVAFDVDSCELYKGDLPEIINRGFTFYSKL